HSSIWLALWSGSACPDPTQLHPRHRRNFWMLDHEKLDVYQRAIEFVACALRIAERLPRGQAPLADQLRRAAVSIPLNIAEGGGPKPRVRGPCQVPQPSLAALPWSRALCSTSFVCSTSCPKRTGTRPSLSWSGSSKCSARCAEATRHGDGDAYGDGDADGHARGPASNRDTP